jgi:YidC/Oxa1 family membrane protein insertase
MNDQRNLLITVALAGLVFLGFYYLYERPKLDALHAQQMAQSAVKPVIIENKPADESGKDLSQVTLLPRSQRLAVDKRVPIQAPSLTGSIRLRGGTVDDAILTRYRETTSTESAPIHLLSPEGTSEPYTITFGWQPAEPNVAVPDQNTLWTLASGEKLTPESPVTLHWNNGQGLIFERVFTIDEHYMLTVNQKVVNTGERLVHLSPFSQIARIGTPKIADFFILHEGPMGVLNGKLEEFSYKNLREKHAVDISTTGGWIGITDKYWLTALIPSSHQTFTAHYQAEHINQVDHYTTKVIYSPLELAGGQTVKLEERVFAGAKQVHLLDHYEKTYGIARFDLAIDFGWFYFLTKPIFSFLNMINSLLGNFGLSILLLTVLIKLALFPLANKSYRSMAKMKSLAPELAKLKEKHGDDRIKMNEEMMGLYRKYQINPLAGCLPMVLQIPVFFALYKVLFVTIEMRHAPFFGWIHDLSAPDPTTLFNLFGLIPWTPPSYLMIGIWPILMGLTMFMQQRLNPQPSDPIQAKMFMFMPLFFTALLAQFSAGLVIYWAWNNMLSIAQQALIMRMEAGKPLLAAANKNKVKPKWKK